MPFTEQLQELQAVPPAFPFVSLYLDVGHTEESAEAMRVFARTRLRQVQSRAKTARERSWLEDDARHILAYLEDVIHARIERKSHGIAIFSCSRQKLFQVISSPEPFASFLNLSDRPHLAPLHQQENTSNRFIACLVDSRSARILEIGPGNVQPQAEFVSDLPRRHHQGGWSQMRFQRHVDDQVDHHHREVALALTHLSDREPNLSIVLGGPEKVVVGFRDHLPDRIQERIVMGLPVALKAHERDIVEHILRSYESDEESRQEKEFEKQLEQARTPTRGARGFEEVLVAANGHAIRRLFMSPDFSERGWRCLSCGALGSRVPLTCGFCGGSIEGTDVRPELVSKVLSSGGEVTTFPPSRSLGEGVVALLRYPV